ncbi:MAG: hypothetical protein BIP78_1664 [Candidatus Bipolaricaulis sibiricus]|uniref:Uncharacterized protein n=1 Tax=Bipolaricaulis sibiricus TaxID=2501609 RepID=A0A410FWT4_BIPS1|nr:MAG: hypothetical protein BIP78_1664 [Candidatus Bipolaricaulis sibiricus]
MAIADLGPQGERAIWQAAELLVLCFAHIPSGRAALGAERTQGHVHPDLLPLGQLRAIRHALMLNLTPRRLGPC